MRKRNWPRPKEDFPSSFGAAFCSLFPPSPKDMGGCLSLPLSCSCCLGSPCRRRPTVCQLTPWPLSLRPVFSGAQTPRTLFRALKMSVKPSGKKHSVVYLENLGWWKGTRWKGCSFSSKEQHGAPLLSPALEVELVPVCDISSH